MTGRCLCGNVSYTTESEPLIVAICHCNNCQRQTGTAYSLVVGVPRAGFSIAGATLAEFETTTESTGTPSQRRFCSNCGSALVTFAEAAPDLALIKAGTLDDQHGLSPAVEVHCQSAFAFAVAEDAGRARFPADLPA
ncbi:MAG TPA: GFA family protein [Solirubrobacteraceae bacterium]|nr:GFA family protein [Solirubrobacteraceae bacterium]